MTPPPSPRGGASIPDGRISEGGEGGKGRQQGGGVGDY